MVEEHLVPAVLDRKVVVNAAVRVYAHTRQSVVVLSEKLLNKAVVGLEAVVNSEQVLLLAEGELH